MSEKQAIKVSEEEIKKIKEFRNSYQTIVSQVGQTELQISDVQSVMDNLKDTKTKLLQQYNEIKQVERTYMDELNKKYGVGTLNIESGLFIPTTNELPEVPKIS